MVRVKVTSTWMARHKVSQQNIAQSITLPEPACILPLVHPCAMCSLGKRHIRTQPFTRCIRKTCPGHLLTCHNGLVLMLTCPLLALLAVDRGQRGHPDWCVAMQPHTQQTAMHCVFWHLSIRTSINFFSKLSNSRSSEESDRFTPHVHKWALTAHDPVGGSPLFLPWTTFDR